MSANGIVPEGQYTSMVYTAIKDGRFAEAVHLLTSELGVRLCRSCCGLPRKLIQDSHTHLCPWPTHPAFQ